MAAAVVITTQVLAATEVLLVSDLIYQDKADTEQIDRINTQAEYQATRVVVT